LMLSFEGNLLTQRHQITSLETRNSRLSYGENLVFLSDLGLISTQLTLWNPLSISAQKSMPLVVQNVKSAVGSVWPKTVLIS